MTGGSFFGVNPAARPGSFREQAAPQIRPPLPRRFLNKVASLSGAAQLLLTLAACREVVARRSTWLW